MAFLSGSETSPEATCVLTPHSDGGGETQDIRSITLNRRPPPLNIPFSKNTNYSASNMETSLRFIGTAKRAVGRVGALLIGGFRCGGLTQ
jgi:hypothetical protein